MRKKTESDLDPKNPVTVTVWNYYNGDQLAAFDTLVEEFNASVGAEKGIVVVSVSQSDISTLANSLIDSVSGVIGAQAVPDLAAVYAETAFILEKEDALAALDPYFTAEELSAYVDGFLSEGRFNENNELLLFPICKSTEVFSANKTDWEPFAQATGITIESIKTKEDLTAAAKAYYEWTDSLTEEPEDGKALYGRDSMANYIYLGSYQLGHNLFSVDNGNVTMDFDRETFKTLWDNYYIPYINGYFGAYGEFRSDDAKTGKILALTSSTSSMGYLPSHVTDVNDNTHDIEMLLEKALPFSEAVNQSVVQQGASFCLLKTSEKRQRGAVEFLKWFTEAKRNLKFSLMSGYSPVTKEANTADAITKAYEGDVSTAKGKVVLDGLLISADVFANDISYASKPFSGSKDIRTVLEAAMKDIAASDRAAVLQAMEQGKTREEAVAPYSTEEYFNTWFDSLVAQIQEIAQ